MKQEVSRTSDTSQYKVIEYSVQQIITYMLGPIRLINSSTGELQTLEI